eukprot:PhF_6_TR35075/c0_g1_i2/m.51117
MATTVDLRTQSREELIEIAKKLSATSKEKSQKISELNLQVEGVLAELKNKDAYILDIADKQEQWKAKVKQLTQRDQETISYLQGQLESEKNKCSLCHKMTLLSDTETDRRHKLENDWSMELTLLMNTLWKQDVVKMKEKMNQWKEKIKAITTADQKEIETLKQQVQSLKSTAQPVNVASESTANSTEAEQSLQTQLTESRGTVAALES